MGKAKAITRQEFDQLKIEKGQLCLYKGYEEKIIDLDKTEGLFRLEGFLGDEWWVRFENVKIKD